MVLFWGEGVELSLVWGDLIMKCIVIFGIVFFMVFVLVLLFVGGGGFLFLVLV